MLIVTYHALGRPLPPLVVSRRRFEDDLHALGEAGYAFVSLDRAADAIAGRSPLPRHAAAVTFDDGYAAVAADGVPVLERLGVPAAIFVIAGRLGGDNQWAGQPSWVPRMPLLGTAALRDLASAGVTIGSHSLSHPRLTALSDAAAREEVIGSADRLEQALQVPVRHFAYPYGVRGPRERQLARARYRTAASAEPGVAAAGCDPHDLPRVDAHDLRLARRLRLLEPGRIEPYLAARRSVRRLRRASERVLGR